MKPMIECPRETDVLDALASKRWPHRVDRDLVDHVASCGICADVLTVAAAIREDHDAIWQEAIREASRPLTFAYVAAASVALVLMAAVGWFAWPTIHDFAASIVTTPKAEFASPLTLPLLVALGAFLIVAPVALYFVLSDE